MSGALLVSSEDQCLSSTKSMYHEMPKLRQSLRFRLSGQGQKYGTVILGANSLRPGIWQVIFVTNHVIVISLLVKYTMFWTN